jgi:hypothetical protein
MQVAGVLMPEQAISKWQLAISLIIVGNQEFTRNGHKGRKGICIDPPSRPSRPLR